MKVRVPGKVILFGEHSVVYGKFIPFDLIVSSTIPMGAGLGSSASFSVAIASIFIKYFMNPEIDRHQDLTDRWAFTLEKIIHGNPSGVDNKIVHYGEWFHSLKFVLVDTMIPRDTKKMVNNVSIKFQRRPKLLGDSFKKMDEISNKFEQFLKIFKCEKMAFSAISNLFSKNQHHLKVLGVSHPVIEKVITISKKHGHQAKLTGGGGGGFLVVLINPNVDEKDEVYFYKELTLNGFKYYNVKLGGKGLQFEE
ncbi:GHMP Kinase, C-terminal domain-containing protein [Rozella allomycis CSF55]|uniref:mevalonate kinase n=1 Tax=Rozella allomycis (strain CSF55) TaxID=988480 RepID=A0A4P9YK19_ROZAC|nr:GHMP Kinase, C-terminal domain-containing protein [Rozella allomycis CSF55]